MNPSRFTGLKVLFAALNDSDRTAALSLLSRERHAPRVNALPDIFALIPTDIPIDMQASIARGMLSRAAESLASAGAAQPVPPLSGDESSGGSDFAIGDVTIAVPIPEFAVMSYVRNELGGAIPQGIIGSLNLAGDAIEETVQYGEGDEYLEGGFLSSLAKLASKAKGALAKAAPLLSNVAGPLAKAVGKISSSPVGKILTKVAKAVPGLGTVISGAELASDLVSSFGGQRETESPPKNTDALNIVADNAASLIAKTAASLDPNIASKSAREILNDNDNLEANLVSTFGEAALDNALLNLMAAEGDLYGEIESGAVLGLPPALGDHILSESYGDLFSGDKGVKGGKRGTRRGPTAPTAQQAANLPPSNPNWWDTAKSWAEGSYDFLKERASNAAEAGQKAYTRLYPKMKDALDSPWGKAAAGAGAATAAGLLYLGASKIMKNRSQLAAARLAKAKKAADKRRAQERSLTPEGSSAAPETRVISPPPLAVDGSIPGLPEIPGVDGKGGTGIIPGPISGTVQRTFIKVPFAGVDLVSLAKEGKDVLDEWQSSFLTVNPAFTGDIGNLSYHELGASFLLHGFPVSELRVIPKTVLPQLLKEIEAGAKLTSPKLTTAIIAGLLSATDGVSPSIVLSVKNKKGSWEDFSTDGVGGVTLTDGRGRFLGDDTHISDADILAGDDYGDVFDMSDVPTRMALNSSLDGQMTGDQDILTGGSIPCDALGGELQSDAEFEGGPRRRVRGALRRMRGAYNRFMPGVRARNSAQAKERFETTKMLRSFPEEAAEQAEGGELEGGFRDLAQRYGAQAIRAIKKAASYHPSVLLAKGAYSGLQKLRPLTASYLPRATELGGKILRYHPAALIPTTSHRLLRRLMPPGTEDRARAQVTRLMRRFRF